MQLTVPQRNVADESSFPTDPDGVNRWLSLLNPGTSSKDAMEVYRGLRHSNRLHNDPTRRRAVVACFVPTLRNLGESLREICQAQPLPMTAEFQRSVQLLDGLLREEAFAFKILLADSPQPRANDLRRAMQALAHQAECRVLGYKRIPESLLSDAHQLYELAEEFSLLNETPDEEHRSTLNHYQSILLLSLADCRQHRARQLGPLIEFLQIHAASIRLVRQMPVDPGRTGNFAVHLKHGARPVAATSLLAEGSRDIRWFNVSTLLTRIDVHLAHSNAQQASVLGSDTLDRESLARLRVTFARSRRRRANRVVSNENRIVVIGHKSMCAHMHLAAAKAASVAAEKMTDNLAASYEAMARAGDVMRHEDDQQWSLINHSPQGAALFNPNCHAGAVQVGELISIQTFEDPANVSTTGRSKALVGIVRWVAAGDGNAIRLGVEFLAKGVLPVGLSRTHSSDIVADDALIVACKVQNKVLQTILLPAYLYQVNDRLTVTLNGKSRDVRLNHQLQHNGLFSHFSLLDV